MKKYKVQFSIFNLLSKSQTEVVQLQTIWAGLSAVITGATLMNSNMEFAFYSALFCAFIDKAIACFYFEEKK
jgi:hypothetical protein